MKSQPLLPRKVKRNEPQNYYLDHHRRCHCWNWNVLGYRMDDPTVTPLIQVPKPQTLKKYGLTEDEWLSILRFQNYRCAICGNSLENKRCNTDHFHVKGFKKLPAEKRKLYTRGILCWTCNHLIVGRGVTIERLEKALLYMRTFEKRKPK